MTEQTSAPREIAIQQDMKPSTTSAPTAFVNSISTMPPPAPVTRHRQSPMERLRVRYSRMMRELNSGSHNFRPKVSARLAEADRKRLIRNGVPISETPTAILPGQPSAPHPTQYRYRRCPLCDCCCNFAGYVHPSRVPCSDHPEK